MTLETIAVIEAAINLAIQAGINIDKLKAMRDANSGGPLTDAQRQELADEAQQAIDRL